MHNGVSEDRDLCHRASTRGPGLLQGEERMSFKPNEKESALQLIEHMILLISDQFWATKMSVTVSSILYCFLWPYCKTKLNSACQPQPFRHTWPHMAPNGRSASPFWSCTSPRSPNDLSSCYRAIQVGPCCFAYLIYLGFLSLSSVLFLGWSGGSLAGSPVFCFHCVPPGHSLHLPLKAHNGNQGGAVEVFLYHGPQDELGKEAAKEVLLVSCHRWGNQGWACK